MLAETEIFRLALCYLPLIGEADVLRSCNLTAYQHSTIHTHNMPPTTAPFCVTFVTVPEAQSQGYTHAKQTRNAKLIRILAHKL
jgi:hypothetical protein